MLPKTYALRAIFLALVTSLQLLLLGASARADVEVSYATVGWWTIKYKEIGDLNGCFAASRFTDNTALQFALIQSDSGKTWAVIISNPRWNKWISGRTKHELWLSTTKLYRGQFQIGSDKKTLFFAGASEDFISSVADAHALQIFDTSKRLLASLSMKDSEAAIRSVVNCVADHPLKQAPKPQAQTTMSGSGFFVAPNSILTDNHVVAGCTGPIRVRYPERTPHEAKIAGQDDTNDLALLQTDLPQQSVASFRIRPRLGEAVAVFGFPYAGTLSSSGNFTLGNVSSLSGIKDDTRFLQITAPIQPGDSGGPVLDMSGRVVGVIVSQLDALSMMQAGRSVPQNVNFAIQVPILLNFLTIKGVSPKLDLATGRPVLSPADIAEIATKFTVRIYCRTSAPSAQAAGRVATVSQIVGDGLKLVPVRMGGAKGESLTKFARRHLHAGKWHWLDGAT